MTDRKSVIMNNVVVWGVTPCSLLEIYKSVGGTYGFQLHSPLKGVYTNTFPKCQILAACLGDNFQSVNCKCNAYLIKIRFETCNL
jgi:hypothetical protein